MTAVMHLIALLLAMIGIWISFYFTGVSYHWFSPNVKWVPQVCQLKEASCQLVLETPRAKLFGIPNSVYGILLYLWDGRLFLSYLLKTEPSPIFWWVAFLATGAAVIRSVYLAYSLLFVTRIPCPLCFTSHGINLILFIYLSFIR